MPKMQRKVIPFFTNVEEFHEGSKALFGAYVYSLNIFIAKIFTAMGLGHKFSQH